MRTALIVGTIPLLCCVPVSQNTGTQHWRSHSEVYELAVDGGILFAKTSGGVMAYQNGQWRTAATMPPSGPTQDLSVKGDGAFLSATTRYENKVIASFWGGKDIFAVEGETATALFPRPPTEGDYALAATANLLYAGTNQGLFVRAGDSWKKVDIGGELPFARIHGISKLGNDYVIGGIDGVAVGQPGNWNSLNEQPVRTLLQSGKDVWIVYGSGAVDKVAATRNLHPDVLYGAARRPWTSAIAASPDGTLLFGGLGGWVGKGKNLSEQYPASLKGEVITAIATDSRVICLGTQGKGLVIIDRNVERWFNPGNGLADTWVTAISLFQKDVVVATATAGLFRIGSNRAEKISSPSQKLRHLAIYRGRLVIGALDGAWIRDGNSWTKLETDSLETTCLTVIGPELWVGTPRGLFRIRR